MQTNLGQLLFDNKAVLVIKQITDYRHTLHPSEQALIKGAIEKRVQEFSTGRFCAHQALHELGIDDFPILKGEQREPIWPESVVGSISHCQDIAGAAVSETKNFKSIGLDIETIRLLNPGIARHVCTSEEKQWIASQDAAQQNLALLLIFSLKEAMFKCIYQATKEHLHFHQCQVKPSLPNGKAHVTTNLARLILLPEELSLHFHFTKTHIFCGACWVYRG